MTPLDILKQIDLTTKSKTSCGIYMILCAQLNKAYIGQSTRLSTRWYEHKKQLKLNKHTNKGLLEIYNKYGKDALVFYVLENCEKENLSKRETYWHSLFDKDLLVNEQKIDDFLTYSRTSDLDKGKVYLQKLLYKSETSTEYKHVYTAPKNKFEVRTKGKKYSIFDSKEIAALYRDVIFRKECKVDQYYNFPFLGEKSATLVKPGVWAIKDGKLVNLYPSSRYYTSKKVIEKMKSKLEKNLNKFLWKDSKNLELSIKDIYERSPKFNVDHCNIVHNNLYDFLRRYSNIIDEITLPENSMMKEIIKSHKVKRQKQIRVTCLLYKQEVIGWVWGKSISIKNGSSRKRRSWYLIFVKKKYRRFGCGTLLVKLMKNQEESFEVAKTANYNSDIEPFFKKLGLKNYDYDYIGIAQGKYL